ncbi:uncharacterized protein MJAP1_003513 [Malassezia japonica]|uniref:Calcineurin-like phosphoesterase domain-containing protein n=1 Tax=Malassezia japonica TaxID=223818 RepID=A0AAF0JB45_9BASI|nr:uncharacterized protein MJAP1_003513 [Malassezia japonica]WFD40527.1 hypothetical protein MJAP1_003513 [Malassezia japonica]
MYFTPKSQEAQPRPIVTAVDGSKFPDSLNDPSQVPTSISDSEGTLPKAQMTSTPPTFVDDIVKNVTSVFDGNQTWCDKCKAALPIGKKLALAKPGAIPGVLIDLCKKYNYHRYGKNPDNNLTSLPDGRANQFSWDWDYISKLWHNEGWINSTTANEVRTHYGGYSITPRQGLRVITFNTDFWYNGNAFAFINTSNPDVSGVLRFVTDELQAAEDAGQRVWVVGHVLPGWDGYSSLDRPTNLFYQIVTRYSHTIAAMFFGHTHEDQFAVYYHNTNGNSSSASRKTEDAVAISYISPSITPLTNMNPGIRVLEVDPETYEVVDYAQYYTPLQKVQKEKETKNGLVWYHLYSARATYGDFKGSVAAGNYSNVVQLNGTKWPSDAPLNATFWSAVADEVETRPELAHNGTKIQIGNKVTAAAAVESPELESDEDEESELLDFDELESDDDEGELLELLDFDELESDDDEGELLELLDFDELESDDESELLDFDELESDDDEGELLELLDFDELESDDDEGELLELLDFDELESDDESELLDFDELESEDDESELLDFDELESDDDEGELLELLDFDELESDDDEGELLELLDFDELESEDDEGALLELLDFDKLESEDDGLEELEDEAGTAALVELADDVGATEVELADDDGATEVELADDDGATEVELADDVGATEVELADDDGATEVELADDVGATEVELADDDGATEVELADDVGATEVGLADDVGATLSDDEPPVGIGTTTPVEFVDEAGVAELESADDLDDSEAIDDDTEAAGVLFDEAIEAIDDD